MNRPSRASRGAAAAILCLATAAPVHAQCATSLQPAYGLAQGAAVPSIGSIGLRKVLRWGDDIVVAGDIYGIGGASTFKIARWDGAAWHPLPGNGIDGINGTAYTLGTMPNGDLLVGGSISSAGGTPAASLASYREGSGWTGYTINSDVHCSALLPNGDLIIGGYFTAAFNGATSVSTNRIARRNGTTWQPMGAGFDGAVFALCVRQNGELIAGGAFGLSGATATPRIARWDGASWQPLASACNGEVRDLLERGNGDLIASGSFTSIDGVAAKGLARFDGAQWHAIDVGPNTFTINDLIEFPDGRLGVLGAFSQIGGVPANYVAAWDGAGWQGFGTTFFFGGPVQGAFAANGDLVLVGRFQTAGGVTSPFVTQLASTCPAQSTLLGGGCAWSQGSNALSDAPAWSGTTWTATGSDLPPSAIALAVYGLSTAALPLANVFAMAGAGCTLWVQPDAIDAGITSAAGTFTSQLPLPNAPALIGASFHFQMIPIELGPLGAFGAVTATAARSVTIGTF